MEMDPTVLELKSRLVTTIVNQAPQMKTEQVVERAASLWAWISDTGVSADDILGAIRRGDVKFTVAQP